MTAYNGLHNKEDMVGTVHGKWTVLSYSHKDPKSGNWYYNCRCECGNESKVIGSGLRRGTTTQCRSCSGKINGRKGLYSMARKATDLYFIRVGDYFKIGVSNNVRRRVRDIESQCPYPVELIYHGVGEAQDEELWHKVFEHRHHRGEWFHSGSCEI